MPSRYVYLQKKGKFKSHQYAILNAACRRPMEHASAVVLHLGLLEVEVCLVRSNDSVAVPHRVHPDWWPENINLKHQGRQWWC